MPRVNYTAPATVDEAVKALASAAGSTKVLSGGTDLLVQLKSGRVKPDLIVDTKRIPELIGIREEGGSFVIGAATPGVMLSADERLEHALPGVVEGVDLIGSTQIQGRASIAGNLCNASPAADSVPPVIAARGIAVVAGPNGRREVPVENIVTGPGQTSLAKGEFVIAFKIPKPKPRQAGAYLRFIPRTEMDIAVVGVAVDVSMTRRWPISMPRRSAPASRSTTSAARSNTAPRSPACSRAGPRPSPLNAPRRAPKERVEETAQ